MEILCRPSFLLLMREDEEVESCCGVCCCCCCCCCSVCKGACLTGERSELMRGELEVTVGGGGGMWKKGTEHA